MTNSMSLPEINQAELQGPEDKHSADSLYSDEQLILASRLYYLDGLTQTQIAQLMSSSQAKISRILTLAREREIVQINVPDYNPRDEQLEAALCEALPLKGAIVVRRLGDQTVNDLRRCVGYFAAPFVSQWIPDGSTVAVAGGRTVRYLAERLQATGAGGVTVVQCMGNIGKSFGPNDATGFGRAMAKKLSGELITIDTPVLCPDEKACSERLASPPVRDALALAEQADYALVGVGSLHNSMFLEDRILHVSDIELLRGRGAVAEVAGRFFDAQGEECDTPFKNRVVSIRLAALRNMNHVVGVVMGCDRVEALLGAIRGRVLDYLVIDDHAAHALLEGADSLSPIRSTTIENT